MKRRSPWRDSSFGSGSNCPPHLSLAAASGEAWHVCLGVMGLLCLTMQVQRVSAADYKPATCVLLVLQRRQSRACS